MPRGKKSPARRGNHIPRGGGRGRGGGWARHGLNNSFIGFSESSETSTPRGHHAGFMTLAQEARNTERNHSWNTDQRLRHTQVNFVSAGSLEPTKSDEPEPTGQPEAELVRPDNAETAMEKMTLDAPMEHSETVSGAHGEIVVEYENEDDKELGEHDEQVPKPSPPMSVEVETEDQTFSFVVDTHGSTTVPTGLPFPQIRSPSPTPSDSSVEVILFRGRGHTGQDLSRSPEDSRDRSIRVIDDMIHQRQEELSQSGVLPSVLPLPSAESSKDFEALLPERKPKGAHRGQRGSKKGKGKDSPQEDAVYADYIDNIEPDDLRSLRTFGARELGSLDDSSWQNTESTGQAIVEERKPTLDGWDRECIDDFGDMSTSDGVMGEVQTVLDKRERPSGSQYLIVWEDQTVDECRWVPVTTLTSSHALLLIQKFEAEENLAAFVEDDDDTSNSDGDMGDSDDEDTDDDIKDEEEFMKRTVDRMTDDQIARRLAKQEELGIGGDEILLFDEEDGDELFTGNTFSIPRSKKSRDKAPRGAKRPRGEYPSATMMAGAYDGFDVMDFDRPSLKTKPKSRRGKPTFDISDSELEVEMLNAWEGDRAKKKERKQAREELRAQGLLANKNGKHNLKAKYKEGMSIYAVKEEIKEFLINDNTTLALPPMEKADRKVVHELAQAFNLKSKSAGVGKKRFPVLTKTQRTISFRESIFDAVESKISRRFLPRGDVGNSKGRGGGGGGGAFGRGGGHGGGYKDGDVVGESAPELAADNKGRKMLEKMGFTTGMALGAVGNKGIMLPVSHVVKTTRSGLG